MRATSECAQLTEWFAAGTAPTRADDWERGGTVSLPDEYAEWPHQGVGLLAEGVMLSSVHAGSETLHDGLATASRDSAHVAVAEARARRFRIISPSDGDHYSIPAGVDARYATISLHAGGDGAEGVRWSVDGKDYAAGRWPLVAGAHEIRARSARGETTTARIVVDP